MPFLGPPCSSSGRTAAARLQWWPFSECSPFCCRCPLLPLQHPGGPSRPNPACRGDATPRSLTEPNSTTRTPATNTGYGQLQRTSSQQFYNKFATSQCQSPTSRHVKKLGCGKFLPVGGVRSRCSCWCPCSGVWLIRNNLRV